MFCTIGMFGLFTRELIKTVVTFFFGNVGACCWMFIKAIWTVSIPIACPTFRNALPIRITTEEQVLFTMITFFFGNVGACCWMFIKAIWTVSIPIACPKLRNTLPIRITTEELALFAMELVLVSLARFLLLIRTV